MVVFVRLRDSMVFVKPLHGEHRVTCPHRVSAYSYTVTLIASKFQTSLLLFQLPSADSYTELLLIDFEARL